MSNPTRWQRMWQLFERAVAMPSTQRDGFLDQECGGEPELRAEVKRLLAAHADAPSLLDPLQPVAEEVDDPLIGQRIGVYRIQRVLGHGGMGTVYQAEQEEPIRRAVALKLIRLGMDTEEVVARFESERQALALMEHPNIATVYDAGASDEGRPYFVMELVTGQPLTEYCDGTQLTLQQRLELFVSVCHAVQHAHHKGVVHRDLKPSNILVTQHDGRPAVKVIDFGIAKAIQHRLTDKSLATELGAIIGTPGYMSPEQAARVGDVDTRTDVYSLGVVLYELLVGELPIDALGVVVDNPVEVERALSESDPATPSSRVKTLGEAAVPIAARRRSDATSLRRQLKGELDWIVMRALARDRDRRYGTPLELASDIERYLQHQPVLAGPPGALYRVQTFLRRHRLGVAVATSLLAALCLGLAGTTWMAVEARRQRMAAEEARDRAEQDAEIARSVNRVLDELLSAPDPFAISQTRASADVKVIDVIDNASQMLPNLEGHPVVEAALRRTLGRTYLNLGKKEEALAHFQRAVEICTRVLGKEHPDTLTSQHNLALALKSLGQLEEAETLLRSTLELRRLVLGNEHRDTMSTAFTLANTVYTEGRADEAQELLEQLLDLQQRVLGDEDPDTIETLNSMVFIDNQQGRHREAIALARRILELRRRTLGEEHFRTLISLGNLATMYFEAGELEQARALFTDQLRLDRRVLGDSHPSTLLATQNLAAVLTRLGNPTQALPLFETIYQQQQTSHDLLHPAALVSAHNYARTLIEVGREAQAEEIYREILPRARQVLGDEHYLVATFEGGLGASLLGLGRLSEAEPHLLASYQGFARTLEPTHPNLTTARRRLVRLYREWGRPERAAPYDEP